jgi:hypothetical protein
MDVGTDTADFDIQTYIAYELFILETWKNDSMWKQLCEFISSLLKRGMFGK